MLNGLLNHVVKELNVEVALKSSILVMQKATSVPPSWSFLNGLLNYVDKELDVKDALNLSILVAQKAAAVPPSWSFLNGLLNHVVKELNVEEVLKSPFFCLICERSLLSLAGWIHPSLLKNKYREYC